MLKYIKIKNFLSFNEETVLDFISNNRWELKDNVFSIGKTVLAKNLIVYWANASGKSNILKAISFLKYFTSVDDMKNATVPFLLDKTNENKPSFFEVWFFVNWKEYKYAFEVTWVNVVSEKLYRINTKEELLFDREWFKWDNWFENELKKWEWKIKKNSSILSVLSRWNWQLDWKPIDHIFKDINLIWLRPMWPNLTIDLMDLEKNKEAKAFLIKFMQYADIAIDDIQIKIKDVDIANIPEWFLSKMKLDIEKVKKLEEVDIKFWHKYNWNKWIKYFDFNIESDWTRRLFNILWPIVDTIFNEKVLFVDEIESNLHLLIVEAILKLVNSNIKNKKYQILFTTHNIDLLNLDILKKDQICFAEKNKNQGTDIYKLTDVNLPIRKELDIKKFYKNWALWAVPDVLDFNLLLDSYGEK